MASKFKVKIFRRPASEKGDLQSDIASWLNQMAASNYIIQSMAQSVDVVTTYAANYEDWEDTTYITVTFMATYIPTS